MKSGLIVTVLMIGWWSALGCAAGSAGRNLANVVQYASTPKPNSVESTLRLTEEEQRERVVLTRAEQQTALSAMRSIAEEHQQVQSPHAAIHGVRWRDVPVAMRHACEEVEMAIARTQRNRAVARSAGDPWQDDTLVFTLTTIDERLVTVTVHRLNDERVYEAHAVVGRFEHDAARAERLLAAFDRSMRALGRKRGFE